MASASMLKVVRRNFVCRNAMQKEGKRGQLEEKLEDEEKEGEEEETTTKAENIIKAITEKIVWKLSSKKAKVKRYNFGGSEFVTETEKTALPPSVNKKV